MDTLKRAFYTRSFWLALSVWTLLAGVIFVLAITVRSNAQTGPAVAGGATQGVLLEYWTNLDGVTVKAMLADKNYPLNPDGVELCVDFEETNYRGAFYGERMRAWLVAPESGEYTFWLASDDDGELWLSPDDDPAHKQRIASVPYWTDLREWTKYPEQRSAAIQLEAGRRYYIETLHYQWWSGVNLSVGWQRPGVTNVAVITGAYLTPYNSGLGGEGITREVWTNMVAGSDLTNSAFLGQPAALMEQVTALEAPTNVGINYGQRLHGYIHAPVSGTYTFWIAGGQNAQLWLGTGDNPTNKQLVAVVPGATGFREWNKYPGQRSAAVTLAAGGIYYVAVLDEETGGTIPVSVAWQMPDGTFEGPIPAMRLTPYDSDYDGMPDWYERQEGLNPYDPDDAGKDADFDGLSNLAEYQAGSDPRRYDVDIVALGGLSAAGSTRGLLWECWTNFARGNGISCLTGVTNYPLKPDQRDLSIKFESLSNKGHEYGERMRGWLLPPVTGDYTFWIASDDEGELWLSTGENPAQKKRIASVPYWAGFRDWTKYLEQCSGPIHLEAGKAYYIEGLHHQSENLDNFAVAWQPPGATQPEVISAPYVAPYNYGRLGEGLTREVWTNVAGVAVADLTNSAVFRQPAGLVEEVVGFETPANLEAQLRLSVGNNSGERLRGYLHPPVSGAYRLWIAGADTAQLWMGTDDTPANRHLVAMVPGPTGFREWNKYPAQSSGLVNLEGGKSYYVEALHKAGVGTNYVSVAWQLPDGTFEGPVPGTRLTPYDSDFDGMPDWYETKYGFNPYNPDDASQDADGDGLSNLHEFQLGTDPGNWDTFGNGVPDGVEVLLSRTNLTGGGAVLAKQVAGVSGAQGRAVLGRWQVDGTDLYALDRRGAVEFTLSTTNSDMYVLELEGTQNQPASPVKTFDVILSVDGENLGHHMLTASYGTNGITSYVTPFLLAGPHTVRVFWDGAASFSSLRIRQVSFVSVADADADHNGIKDWVDRMLNLESGLDTNAPSASYVSPVCLEGRDPYLSMMAVKVGSGGGAGNLVVQPNAGQRWYANVPLSAGSNTRVSLSYQNGVVVEHRQVQWLPINVLNATNLIIRAGDNLLLTAGSGAEGNVRLSISSGSGTLTNITTTATQPVPYMFIQAGTYTVTAIYAPRSHGPAQTGGITVTVIGYSFPNNPDCMVNRLRSWNLTNVPPQISLEVDPRLNPRLIESLPDNGRSMELLVEDNYACAIVARLGNQGPILGGAKADSFRLFATPDTYNTVIQHYSDGSQLVETMDILSPLLPDLSLQLKIIVGGVTFDDGTLVHDVTAGDFDPLGESVIRFLMPAWVQTANCHTVQVFQGDVLVGTY